MHSNVEPFERRLLMSSCTVNTLSDAINPGGNRLTLRQAIADANAAQNSETITFDPTVFTPGRLHTITLTQGQLELSNSTTIIGPGSSVLAISGGGKSRVLQIGQNISVVLSGITVTGGNQTAADNNGNTYGGGIYNEGDLTLTNSAVSGNKVTATAQASDGFAGDGYGGGIYSIGTLTITSSTLSANKVANTSGPNDGDGFPISAGSASGGGVYSLGPMNLTSDVISGNSAYGVNAATTGFQSGPAHGGGIYAGSTVSISASSVTGNTAAGGRTQYSYEAGAAGDASGGGLFAVGTTTISNSTFTLNQANGGNGGLDSGSSGGASGGGIDAGSALTITNSTISDNAANGAGYYSTDHCAGGGVFAATNASLIQCDVEANTVTGGPPDYEYNGPSAAGGGVYTGGQITLMQSTISGNTEAVLYPEFGQFGGECVGGGVAAIGGGAITDSTIAKNAATGGAGYTPQANDYLPRAGGDGLGGGVYSNGLLTITNSTITGDAATGGSGGGAQEGVGAAQPGGNAAGGGIYSNALIVADSTITGNTATGGAAGTTPVDVGYTPAVPGTATGSGVDENSSSSVITSSIISDNKAANTFSDITGTQNAIIANNLIGVAEGLTNGARGNIVGVNDPKLSPLGNYGGPTQTMIPLPGSPAIGAGNINLVPIGLATDQRGYPRITGKSLDIGAVQFGSATLAGTVFADEYASGMRQKSEPGLAGFTVYLDLNHDGQFDAGDLSAITNSAGIYSFSGVPAGLYSLNIVGQRSYRSTTPVTLPVNVPVTNGTTISGPTFGETQDALVTGTVFNATTGKPLYGWRVYIDLNNDGKFESNEPSFVTTSNGNWSFNIPSPRTYQIRIVPMAKYKTALPSNGLFTFSVGKASARIGNVFAEMAIS